ARLPALVAEARRFGGGSVGVRWLEHPSPAAAAGGPLPRVLALVESAPFHALLRAVPTAYAQQAPRVWVEVGWRHPLAEMIQPPDGRIALLRPPRLWEFVADGPYRGGPDAFPLPRRPAAADRAADMPLPVALRLIPDHGSDLPELWVLHDRPFDRLRAL